MHVVATAGHVDHGKSTLLRAITGMEPDRWREERERGLTIDLGFVWCELRGDGGEPITVAFVDVPGHERFIANMLAGAGAIRAVLFVVAADDGWSAQSQEHLDILDLLGVSTGVVAVTKAAAVSRGRAEEVAEDVARRLEPTALAGAPIVVTDAPAGEGLDRLTAVLHARLSSVPPPPDHGRPRLWVDRSFTISGAGTVVTGTLGGGSLAVGDEVAILPAGLRSRVRGLQALGEPRDRVPPGSRVAVNLAGVDHDAVGRGDAVVRAPYAGRWIVATEVDAHVRALPGTEIETRGAWHLHVGSAETVCGVHPLLDPVRDGDEGLVTLTLERPLPLVSGDRFVLRESGRRATLGGGEVLDPDPPGRPRGLEQRVERSDALERIRAADDRLSPLVAHPGARLAARARAAVGATDGTVPDDLIEVSTYLVHTDAFETWSGVVTGLLEADDGTGRSPEELARVAAAAGSPTALAPALVEHLAARGRLRRVGNAYLLPEQASRAEQARDEHRDALLALLSHEPLQPPKLEEAAAEAGVDYLGLQRLEQEGAIVRCGDVAFTRRAVDEAVARLRELEREVGPFTAAQAKDAWNTTRRYAIPLLEHLDAAGVTDFDGRLRHLRG